MKRKSLFLVVCVLLVVSLSLVACTPSKDSLIKKYTDAEYTAVGISSEDIAKNAAVSTVLALVGVDVKELTDSKEGIDYVVTANKLLNTAVVIAFKKGADAKEFYATLLGDKKESKYVVKKGNAIIIGTEDALAIA